MATIKFKNPNYVEGESDKWLSLNTLIQAESDKIVTDQGDGTKYLSDDGTYKEVVTDLTDYATKNYVTEQVNNIDLTEYLTDAPLDDAQYVRKNGEWAKLFVGGKLTLNIISTESEHDVNLTGITIIIKDSADKIIESFMWEGEPVTFNLAAGGYTIEIPDVENYITPTNIIATVEVEKTTSKTITYAYDKRLYTTIHWDQTVTDPASMVTRTVDEGGIEAIRANSHRYNGTVVDGIMQLTQLPDDGSGTPSSTLGTDVWMKLPYFYYKVEKESTHVWNITFMYRPYAQGELEGWAIWDGKDMIGVYKAVVSAPNLYSINGYSPSVDISQLTFKTYASNRGTGFSTVKWKHHCIMAWLFYAWYSNTNCQAICGSGTSDYPKTTGATNSLGMTDTTTENGNSMSINFWGLENWWGDIYETIDNISVDGATWTITEDDGSTRTVVTTTTSGYISRINNMKDEVAEWLDLVPVLNEGSATTGLCDYHYYNSNSDLVVYRSYSAASDRGGVAYVRAADSASGSYSAIGSRLAYRGDYIIVE